jgi:hypothetical protein
MTLGNAQVCAAQTNPPLPPEEIARQISSYIAAHPHSIIMETGRVLFDLSRAKHSIDATHGRCVLHLWNSDHDALRTVSGLTERNGTLRLATLRLGQKRPLTWELAAADLDFFAASSVLLNCNSTAGTPKVFAPPWTSNAALAPPTFAE